MTDSETPTSLSLSPDLVRDPDRRRERENQRRIEEFVRKLLADQQSAANSYASRFLTGN